MQCEKAYVGAKVPCPSCNAELRVPFSDGPGGGPNALPRAELILEASTEAVPNILADPAKAAANPFETSDIPKQVAPRENEIRKGATQEVHCLCPVCEAELRIPANAASTSGKPPVAELVRKAPPQNPEPSPEANPGPADPHPKPADHQSEREHQIAAAREARPVSVYPAMKPRLSYILSGGEAPGPDHQDEHSEPGKAVQE